MDWRGRSTTQQSPQVAQLVAPSLHHRHRRHAKCPLPTCHEKATAATAGNCNCPSVAKSVLTPHDSSDQIELPISDIARAELSPVRVLCLCFQYFADTKTTEHLRRPPSHVVFVYDDGLHPNVALSDREVRTVAAHLVRRVKRFFSHEDQPLAFSENSTVKDSDSLWFHAIYPGLLSSFLSRVRFTGVHPLLLQPQAHAS